MISTKTIIFLPVIKRRKKRKVGKRKRKGEKRARQGRKILFFPHLQKGEKLSEVSANNVINQVSL